MYGIILYNAVIYKCGLRRRIKCGILNRKLSIGIARAFAYGINSEYRYEMQNIEKGCLYGKNIWAG